MQISIVAKIKSDSLHNKHYDIDDNQDELIVKS